MSAAAANARNGKRSPGCGLGTFPPAGSRRWRPAGRRRGQGRRRGRGGQLSQAAGSRSSKTRTGWPPGRPAAPRDRRHEAPGAVGAAGERSRGRGELAEEASFFCFPQAVKFIPARGPLPFPSRPPGILHQAGSAGSCPPFRSPPKWTSARRHLPPPGPPEHAPHPSAVPACDLPPPPSQSCAPHPTPAPPTAVKPRGTQRSVSGVQGADRGEEAVLGKEGRPQQSSSQRKLRELTAPSFLKNRREPTVC